MNYLYYPGCSLKGTGIHCEKSLLATLTELGIGVEELPDWNCCGATSYMSVNEKSAFAMTARNLAIAEREESDILAPCSACYMILKKTQVYTKKYPKIRESLRNALSAADLSYDGGKQKVVHPLNMLVEQYGLDEIKSRVKRTLKGMKIFPYYGCLIVRPYSNNDHQAYPENMDKLLKALGCSVIDTALKTRCCGGTLTGTIPEVGLRLVYQLLKEAKKNGADAISTICALCQFNLDAYQKQVEKRFGEKFDIPILYFTQILGMALDIDPKELGFEHNIVAADELLTEPAV